jgi:hypothetical protein
MTGSLEEFDHPAWFTVVGTLVGYGLVLLVLFVLMFVVPFGIFVALG